MPLQFPTVRQAALELVREVVNQCKTSTLSRLPPTNSVVLMMLGCTQPDTDLLDDELVTEIKAHLEQAREDKSQLILIEAVLTVLNEHSNTQPPSKRSRLTST